VLSRPPNRIRAQVDNNDTYTISTSLDDSSYNLFWTIPMVAGSGLRWRDSDIITSTPTRYIKINVVNGDGSYSASEIELYNNGTKLGP
jgi:hypothetical protein